MRPRIDRAPAQRSRFEPPQEILAPLNAL